MVKKIFFIICIIFILSSCSSELNPEWYPRGSGKDTVYTLGNGKFHLGKTADGIDLQMYDDNGHSGVVLAFVNEYKKQNGNLYVYSDEGFCVIDENTNTAKVLITVEKQHFSNLVGEDESITYLSTYDEFDENDKSIFDKLRMKQERKK